jgi:hypothetical protein
VKSSNVQFFLTTLFNAFLHITSGIPHGAQLKYNTQFQSNEMTLKENEKAMLLVQRRRPDEWCVASVRPNSIVTCADKYNRCRQDCQATNIKVINATLNRMLL